MKRYLHLCLAVLCLFTMKTTGTDLYVSYQTGKKTNPGTKEKPLPNFHTAVKKLQPGDTLYILPSPSPIRDIIAINYLQGTPDKPITIDGGNNIFLGSMPLTAAEWKESETTPGLFKRTKVSSTSQISRGFFIHKGKAVFMDRASKAKKNPPWPAPEALKPGEWTIVNPEPQNKQNHPFDFYIRLGDGEKKLADGQWEEAVRMSGVLLKALCNAKECGHTKCGSECTHLHCSNLIIRNFIVSHYWNDGYNIHGKIKGITFDHIAAVECGDDGISTHESGEIDVKNFVSIRNSTGICHIQFANCKHDNVYIEGTRGVDFYPINETTTTLTHAYVRGNSSKGILLATEGKGTFQMSDCVFLNENPQACFSYKNKNAAKGIFRQVRVFDYKQVCPDQGIIKVTEKDEADRLLTEKRAEFFKSFGGQLEKACGEQQ